MQCVFRLEHGQADAVSLVGEFNDWSTTATPMRLVGGRWVAHVDLPPGRYRYCFFVMERPGARRSTSAFPWLPMILKGDSILEVPTPADGGTPPMAAMWA